MCGRGEFQCDTGECILDELVCNDYVDCGDASDEAQSRCYDGKGDIQNDPVKC